MKKILNLAGLTLLLIIVPWPVFSQRSNSFGTSIRGLSRDPSQVKFYLVRDWEHHQEIVLNDTNSLEASGFAPGVKTFFLIDGFDSPRTPFYELMTGAIRNTSSTSDANVIIVNYPTLSGRDTGLATNPFGAFFLYLSVLRNVDILGERVGSFLHFLQNQGNLSLRDLHVIGMSMGCHVAGAAGIYLKDVGATRNGSQVVGRITGLDPARTAYPLRRVKRLRSSTGAAEFIDAYHTNRGILGEIYEDTADLNVYVNGGLLQPGCGRDDFTARPYPGICSHLFAWEMFSASFSVDFFACPCTGWDCYCYQKCQNCTNSEKGLKIGINAPTSAQGRYHITVTYPLPGAYFREFRNKIFSRGN